MVKRIVSDLDVMLGKPCIVGTRITVEHILDSLADGRSIEDLLAAHSKLTREDILAALAFASDSLRSHAVHSAAGQ